MLRNYFKRFSMRTIASVITSTALVFGSAGGIQANLISNGDFSQFTSSAPGNGPTQILDSATNGFATLNNWTLGISGSTNGNANTLRDAFAFIFPTSNYTSYYPPSVGPHPGTVGLQSSPGTPPSNQSYVVGIDGDTRAATLSQTLTGLTQGAAYQVSFDWAAVQYNTATGAYTEQFQVSLGGSSQLTSIQSEPSLGHSAWISESFTFVADGNTDTLTFLSLGTPNGVPPVGLLSNVDVNAVPEPSTLVMLGLGGVWLVGVRLRRKRLAKTA